MGNKKEVNDKKVVYKDKYIDALEKITDEKLQQYIDDYKSCSETLTVSFTINQNPDQYVNARVTRHGTFNPKLKIEDSYRKEALENVSKEDFDKIHAIMNGDKTYNVHVEFTFYIQTPASTYKLNQFILAEKKIRQPIQKRDIDNMCKLCQDSLTEYVKKDKKKGTEKLVHGFYNDDSYITKLTASKYNSIDPRIEVKLTYITYNEKRKEKRK